MEKFIASILIAGCLLAVAAASDLRDALMDIGPEIRKTCLAETGADIKSVEAANEKGELADDDKFKCYIKCTLAQMGAITGNEVDHDKLIAGTPESVRPLMKKVVEACKETKAMKKGDLCDQPYQAYKCFQSKFPEQFFVL